LRALLLALLLVPAVAHAGGEVVRDTTMRAQPGPARAQPSFVQVTEVGDSTWALSAGTANVVACLTDTGWVLVDTGTRVEAAAIREELRRIAQKPFALVIDTHFHDDHAGGNALYAGMGVPVLATAPTRELVRTRVARIRAGAPREIARVEAYERTLPPGDERARGFLDFFAAWWREALDDVRKDAYGVAAPTQVFTRAHERVVGGTRIRLLPLPGRAHTGGDCVVLFPDRKVAAVGDVYAKGSVPWADQFMGDGAIEGVRAAQDSLLAWIPADSTWAIVPGHGPAARRADLARDRTGLEALRACVRQAKAAGRTPGEIALDCEGAGFRGQAGDYAAWLFLEEWARPAPRKRR
jgi:glyoxylase-like metal-dependent hydrolase (beta-lactamase superfamily II)